MELNKLPEYHHTINWEPKKDDKKYFYIGTSDIISEKKCNPFPSQYNIPSLISDNESHQLLKIGITKGIDKRLSLYKAEIKDFRFIKYWEIKNPRILEEKILADNYRTGFHTEGSEWMWDTNNSINNFIEEIDWYIENSFQKISGGYKYLFNKTYGDEIVIKSIPKVHIGNSPIKAFILGCDPTGFNSEANRLEFEYVFGIGRDKRYFYRILENLNLLNLSLDDIYVQNLVTDYQKQETAKNKDWDKIASQSISERREEFDRIDPSKQIPVFLTSERLYKVLLNPKLKQYKPKELYSNNKLVPIASNENQLGRPLIPLYRHYSYRLEKQSGYRDFLQSIIHSIPV